MDIDLSNFNIRRTNPIILGNAGLPDNLERYIVKGQGLIGIDIFKDDKITIINIEGNQICEAVVFDKSGKNKQSIIGFPSNGNADFIKFVLTKNSDKKKLLSSLKRKNINISNANSSNFFNTDAKANEKTSFSVEEDAFILISAPGEDMEINSHNPPTDLEVFIERNNKKNNKQKSFLPEPLADVSKEYLIKDSTAISYEIKKGDYIQIIDLYGRQCSDFMAFDSNALQKGKEYSIDTTVSRAIHAGSYPMPGLHSKYFDKNFETLVEVVQDTIGRHDTFGTACTQKLYEDLGYFGHVNCSDNFNYALDKFGANYSTNELLLYSLEHRPGALAEFTRKIADAKINLNSFYIMHMEESTAEIAFTVDNVDLVCEMFDISS